MEEYLKFASKLNYNSVSKSSHNLFQNSDYQQSNNKDFFNNAASSDNSQHSKNSNSHPASTSQQPLSYNNQYGDGERNRSQFSPPIGKESTVE